MVTKIEIWRTDDDKDFDTEVEALRHENFQLKSQVDKLNWHLKCQPQPVMPLPAAFPSLPSGFSGVHHCHPPFRSIDDVWVPYSTGIIPDYNGRDYYDKPGIGPF